MLILVFIKYVFVRFKNFCRVLFEGSIINLIITNCRLSDKTLQIKASLT